MGQHQGNISVGKFVRMKCFQNFTNLLVKQTAPVEGRGTSVASGLGYGPLPSGFIAASLPSPRVDSAFPRRSTASSCCFMRRAWSNGRRGVYRAQPDEAYHVRYGIPDLLLENDGRAYPRGSQPDSGLTFDGGAARLEAHSKVTGMPIMIDAATKAGLGDDIPTLDQGIMEIRGKTQGVQVYAVTN